MLCVVVVLASGFSLGWGKNVTIPKPPPIPCEDSLCLRKLDGNYKRDNYPNYFLQCSNGIATCTACYPINLVYKETCNQCMYSLEDPCYTSTQWETQPTISCPENRCAERNPSFTGNIAHPTNNHYYIACWERLTLGCMACPAGLQFNEAENACLYEGQHFTKSPTRQ